MCELRIISVRVEYSLSRVRLFVTPWTAAHQAPLSMGFSRQEYWRGVAISFSRGSSQPRDRSRVSRIVGRRFTVWATREVKKSEVAQSCSDSLRPHGHQAPLSMGFSRQEYWSGLPFPSPGNFPTQGSNPGLPHCRQTLYCLSHQGSLISVRMSSISSVAQLFPTLCDPMDCSTPGLPVHHQLPEFTQTHVHWVGDAIQPSHPLSSPSPPAFNLSQH